MIFPRLAVYWTPKEPVVITPEMIAAEELRDARMDLLKAHKEREYWQSMVPMLEERIARLKHFTTDDEKSQ
jgi:hypothetical protein